MHAFARDVDRLRDWDKRAAVSPLGAGALAGSSLPLDPQAVAAELGFDRRAPTTRSTRSATATSPPSSCFVAAMIGVHLSRLGEEIVPVDVARVRLGRRSTTPGPTGSSIMPQKKNPDIAELARGKSGRLIGNLTRLLTTLKGLPLAYNRDLQEDKEPVFDSVDTLLLAAAGRHRHGRDAALRHRADGGRGAAGVRAGHRRRRVAGPQGRPVPSAHEAPGRSVALRAGQDIELDELDDDELAGLAALSRPTSGTVLSVPGALAARKAHGGTAPDRVPEQLVAVKAVATEHADWASSSPVAPAL